MKICLLCFFILFSSGFYGCSLLSLKATRTEADTPRLDKTIEAQKLLEKLKQYNSSLMSFKGIGNIVLQRNGNSYINERMAWIGAKPLSFSVVILVSGYPALKLSGNGKWFFYYNPNDMENTYKKLRSKNPSLKPLISVPLKASDFIALMAGCIPIPDYHFVAFMSDFNGSGNVMVLKKRRKIRQKIYLDHGGNPYKIETFDREGILSYWVQLEQIQTIDGYAIPMKLTLILDQCICISIHICSTGT